MITSNVERPATGAHTKNLQKLMFFNQGDFGFIRERYDSMETICSSADWAEPF
jgi:hypothetical protein